MPSDAEITLAFVAKRQGTDSMPPPTWAHVMSLELGWMAPGDAKTFVAACQETGLLREEGGAARLGFDRKTVEVPRGFRPPGRMEVGPPSTPPSAPASSSPSTPAADAPQDPFLALVARIASERSMEKVEVLDEVASVQDRFGGRLSAEAAAVRVAATHGLDVTADAADALARITSDSE